MVWCTKYPVVQKKETWGTFFVESQKTQVIKVVMKISKLTFLPGKSPPYVA